MKSSKIGGDKFSKTLSLPVQTWANLETVRSLTRWPDLSVALQDCIDSKYDSLMIIQKMQATKTSEDNQNSSNDRN